MEVKIVKRSDTTDLYINGVKYGENITGYEIKQDACNKPVLTLHCTVDKLGFECYDCLIKKNVSGKNEK